VSDALLPVRQLHSAAVEAVKQLSLDARTCASTFIPASQRFNCDRALTIRRVRRSRGRSLSFLATTIS